MNLLLRFAAFLLCCCVMAAGPEHRGVVTFGGLPVPGASVTALRETQDGQIFATTTDAEGRYTLAGLEGDGWVLQVEMQLFETERRAAADAPMTWELKLVPASQLPKLAASPAGAFRRAGVAKTQAVAANQAPETAITPEDTQRAADGLLINGSVNNGAASPFAQLPAFGNNRRGQRSLYNGNLGLIVNHSHFDARSFSLTGQETLKPAYSRAQGLFSFGGPIRIPRLIQRNGPNFTINYQWTRNSTATVQTALVPTVEQRQGRLDGLVIPASQISPQSRALLDLYPLPNFTGSDRYNYQVPIVSGHHQDDLQTRVNKQIRRNTLTGSFSWQSTRTDRPDLFGFLDTGSVRGINTGTAYRRTISPRSIATVGHQFSRLTSRVTPYFANRRNVSGDAGITGNSQDPADWGPPGLQFSSGLAGLTQAQSSLTRNQTSAVNADLFLSRGRHNITLGGVHRRQQFNLLTQQDARGTFAFTGAATGNDLAGFLLGTPDTSTIAFGNADKYLRAQVHEAYFSDDYRVNPGLTINAGIRGEYWTPATEKYGRLVNLDIAPGFASITPSSTLPRPDRNNLAPRIAVSWRPLAASSMVVRAGYGIYYDTSVYQPIAMQMAQQAPLSKNLRVANSASAPLTLANGFPDVGGVSGTTFAVDPYFRTGYSQNWQLSIQRDLPAALQISATYAGGKGTRAQQQFLPNTYPGNSVSPSGYTYLTSNGNSIRHSGQVQLRRRLRSGLTASANYTFAKSLDNAALGGRNQGGALVAQDWLNLSGERGRSNFDQRHLFTGLLMYTTGMGLRGGSLATGRLAKLLKEWTMSTQVTTGSGLPLTPVYFAAVRGTGVTGSIRPDYTGASLFSAPSPLFLNPAAYAVPGEGHWGNAGRNTITGPEQFSMSASLGRAFRSTDRVSMDFRLDAANVLNNVTYPSWNTVLGSAQFGLPVSANAMRTVQATLRVKF